MNRTPLEFGTACTLRGRTLPILLVRLGVYLAFWLVALVYLSLMLGLSILLGHLIPWLGILFAIIGCCSMMPFYSLAYRYVFYLINAAHLAVIAELLTFGSLPPGVSQFTWGKQQVRSASGQSMSCS